MAAVGLVENILGHVSARVDDDELLIRCRGPHEAGLAATTAADVHAVPLYGRRDLGTWRAPNELPIHTELMRRRADVTAVVHTHPPAVVAFSLLERPLVPIYGAYDIPGARLAADGVPIWPRAALIATDELAGAMADALGDRPALILRGHGMVTVGRGTPHHAVAEAVLFAQAIDSLARITLTVLSAGGEPSSISAEDLSALPDLGAGFNVAFMWAHALTRIGNAAVG